MTVAASNGHHQAIVLMAGRMCLTCGCMDAHKEMGEANLCYEDLQAAATENGTTVDEVLRTLSSTAAKDRGDHPMEYQSPDAS